MILATLCYVKRDGQTLMLHRNKKPNDIHEGKWNGLGGKFEAGESPEMCICREVREEAGLFIHNPRLHGLLIFVNFKGNDWYVFVFSATEFDGELIDSSEGKLEWIDDDKLLDLPFWPSDAVFLPWLKKDEFFSARFLYDGDSMLEYEVTFH
jgi:8-oxo-dGTP diphosphatase